MVETQFEPSWQAVLENELEKPYVAELEAFVEQERASGQHIYPPNDLVFNAFWQTPYNEVKVVIMGQDPYHGPGQAHGLSFSVPKGVPPPPSLQNIFKELVNDVGIQMPTHGCLIDWARQGVLLLNATLTVCQGEPKSHHGKGWERFTDAVITKLAERQEPIIFVLWGNSAKKKCQRVLATHHTILTAPHPSPLSAYRGFFGCKHFSEVNKVLTKNCEVPINWFLG